MAEKSNGTRLAFVIIASAWLVILFPLLIVLYQDPGLASDRSVIFAVVIALASSIGAIATIFYKRWGVILYAVFSALLIASSMYRWATNENDSFPWGLILIAALYAGLVIQAKKKFS